MLLLISCYALAQFNVNISTGATANVTVTNAGTVRTFTANATGANVQIADIIAAYTGGVTEVRILTGTIGGSENGNITLSNAIDYNSIGLGKTLTLIAHSNISITNPITDGVGGGDLLNLSLTGNGTFATGTNAGVRVTSTVITNGGNITIVGTQNTAGAKGVDIPSGTIFTNGGFLNITGTANGANAGANTCDGIDIQATNTNTNGGAIILIGTSSNTTGNNGVQIDSPLNSGSGAVTITGISNGNAVGVVNTLGSITTTSGNITITGTANSTLLTAVPQVFAAGVSIVQPIVTGAGNINITATSAANAPAFFNATVIGNGTITSTSGNITIEGTNTNANTAATLAKGILVLQAITTTSGKMTFTAESNANADAFDLSFAIASSGSITSTSGNIEITGLAKSTLGVFANGISLRQNISTGGSGSITIEGESSANASAVKTNFSPSLSTSNGNISINGVSKNTNSTSFSAQGVALFECVIHITGSGNLVIEGESNSGSQGVLASTGMTTTTIATNTGSVFIRGKSKNTVANSVAVSIAQPVQSALGSITIQGESSGTTTVVGILATLSTTIGNIFIKGQAKNTTTMNGSGININAPISSTHGNITIEGEINAGNNVSAIMIPLGTGSITSTSGNILLKGISKGTARKGVAIERNIASTTGKITIIGETEGQGDAIHIEFNGSVVSAGGDILLDGKCKNTISGAGVRANGAINAGTGKITIMGECDAGNTILQQAQGIFIAATAPLTTNGGDILLNGISRGTTGIAAMGVQLDAVVNAGAGKITIIGENNADNIEAVRVTNALNNTNADISITGRAKNPNNTVAGVRITAPINASRNLSITGASPNNGIFSSQPIQATNNIALLTERGGMLIEGTIQSANGGSIDICVAPSGNLQVTGTTGVNSIRTTNNASINITNGTGVLSVGNPSANIRGLISNGTNTVPEGIYPTTVFGDIRIKGSVGLQTFNPLFTTNLNGYEFILNLDACVPTVTWASILSTADFGLANFPNGTSIRSVFKLNSTQVRVTLNFVGDDIDLDYPTAQLIAKASAFAPVSADVAFDTPVRAGQLLAPVIRGRAGNQSVRLEWASVTGAVNYEIYSLTAGQAQQIIGTTSDTTFVVTGLKNAITYLFRVIAVSKNGFKSPFSNTLELRPSIVLGREGETENHIFKIYPNPSSGVFYLQANELKGKNVTIVVTDLSGRIVYQQNWQVVSSSIEKQLELLLAEGIYLLQIHTETENFKRKLLIEK